MKPKLILAGLIIFTSSLFANATTFDSDGSRANIQALHDSPNCHDGDTITIPAGTFSWTATLDITKGITLRGQTTISGAGTATPTINDLSIVLDNVVPRGAGCVIVRLKLTTSSQAFRMTGITFRKGTETVFGAARGAFSLGTINVRNRNNRVDHCHFDQLYQDKIIFPNGWNEGVFDHNVIHTNTTNVGQTNISFDQISYGKGTVCCSDPSTTQTGAGSFADYPYFGTAGFYFVEDNSFFTDGHVVTDTADGVRFVYRHNYSLDGSVTSHGSESGWARGVRAVECYDNTFRWSPTGSARTALLFRGGSMLVHDNITTGDIKPNADGSYRISGLSSFRVTYVRPQSFSNGWGISDGTSVWDSNVTNVDDAGGDWPTLDKNKQHFVEGNAPLAFKLNTAGDRTATASATSAQGTLTDSTKAWTNNQWVGYSIHKVGLDSCYGSIISSNTATTITYALGGASCALIFNAGDQYQIHKVLGVMYGQAMGKSDPIYGINPAVNKTTNTQSYGHSAVEPCFSWNNQHDNPAHVLDFGHKPTVGPAAPYLAENTHFFNLGNSFPADSTPQKVKDTYTADLNGVQYNGTFTYPHPLVSGASPTPTRTASPSATSTPTATPSATATATVKRRHSRAAAGVWNGSTF